jgi:hypothetical protein
METIEENNHNQVVNKQKGSIDNASFADGSSTNATRTYHFDSSSKSHDATVKSTKSRTSTHSTTHHSKCSATDRIFQTAANFEQIPEDDEIPYDGTNKLQTDLHHLHFESSIDPHKTPSIRATNLIQRYLPFCSSSSAELSKQQYPSSEFLPTSTMPLPLSLPPSFIHQGSAADAAENHFQAPPARGAVITQVNTRVAVNC